MASFWYHSAMGYMMNQDATQSIDLDNASTSYKVALFDAGYVPDPDHDFMDDTVAATNEIVAQNYTGGYGGPGRKSLTTKVVVDDDANNRAYWDADDPSWTTLGQSPSDTISTAVYFKEITSEALSPLICQLDISPDVVTNGGTFTIQHAAPASGGIGYIGVGA